VSQKEVEAKQRAKEARSAMRERRNLTDMINQVLTPLAYPVKLFQDYLNNDGRAL